MPPPVSTPLPLPATVVPLGFFPSPLAAELDLGTPTVTPRPVYMGFVIFDANFDQRQARVDLQESLNAQVGNSPYVEIEIYENQTAALAAVCSGRPVLVWVDAFTYVAAEQRGCGVQPLQGLVRGSNRLTAVESTSFVMLYNTESAAQPPPSSLENIKESAASLTICRLNATDPYSWIYPALVFQAGVSPSRVETTPTATPARPLTLTPAPPMWEAIIDTEDYAALVRAIFDETCDLGAVPADQLDNIIEAIQEDDEAPLEIDLETEDSVLRLVEEPQGGWLAVPYEVLIAPPDGVFPPELRERILTALEELLEESDQQALYELLLGEYQEITPRTAADYQDFRDWLEVANWGMAR